jgi:hypothetical protein
MRPPGAGLVRSAYVRCLQTLGRRLTVGVNVFEYDWDVLVVLDACRVDLMRSVAPEVAALGPVETIRSVGSSSSEWLEGTFHDRPETARTAMVTGNTWTDRYLTPESFALLDEVWKYAWDEELGTVPPEAVTDRAVAVARDDTPDRLVAHYMQPHHPFIPRPLAGDDGMVRSSVESSDSNPWVLLRRGELSKEEVWAAYEANLRYVLPYVEQLVENVSGRVVISSDHANLFGEWGLYGHPMQVPVPALVTVPWVVCEGGDQTTYSPSLTPPEEPPVEHIHGAGGADDRLRALGYR